MPVVTMPVATIPVVTMPVAIPIVEGARKAATILRPADKTRLVDQPN